MNALVYTPAVVEMLEQLQKLATEAKMSYEIVHETTIDMFGVFVGNSSTGLCTFLPDALSEAIKGLEKKALPT